PVVVAVGQDAEQLDLLDLEPGLLARLAARRLPWLLVDLEVTGRERPMAPERLDAPLDQEDLGVADHRGDGPERGVLVEDAAAAPADAARPTVDRPFAQRAAAVGAEPLVVGRHARAASSETRDRPPSSARFLRTIAGPHYHPRRMRRVHVLG